MDNAALVSDVGKDDFKALEWLHLGFNHLADEGLSSLVSALDADAVPNLNNLLMHGNPAARTSIAAVNDALARLRSRRSAKLGK